jgi:serine/threonine protein kinase
MGSAPSKVKVLPPVAHNASSNNRSQNDRPNSQSKSPRPSRIENIHPVNPDIKVHSVISMDLDWDHNKAMEVPLGECTDEQLLAEVARRKLDLHDKITDALIKETYDIGKILGHGASGKVYLATHKITGQKFACKVVKKNNSMNDAQSMSTEIEIMKRIRHRNIVSMYELYETPKCLWIILELVDGGDLHHFLANTMHYNEVMAARQFKQILTGCHYLHSLGVVHRDLKLDNILMSGSGANSEMKIADFGLSALVRIDEEGYDPEESGKRKNYRQLKDMWGTKEYFAPEVIEQAYGPQADVWALGCVLYEMLSGEQAFPVKEGDTESKFYGRIMKGDFDLTRPVWKKISAEAKDLVVKMLKVDPNMRVSASECLLHPWITGQAHRAEHLVHLEDAQRNMKARLERRAKRAAQNAAAHSSQ